MGEGMPIRKIDMHGMTVAQAETVFHSLLNEIRLAQRFEIVHFITGNGPIKLRIASLSKNYALEHHTPMANKGMLVVEFE